MDLICSLHLQSILSISVFHSGGDVVHSYGRLIPHEFPITDLQQISGPDGIGRINCTVSRGTARFYRPVRIPVANQDTLAMKRATLVVNTNVANIRNRERYCKNAKTNYFYIFLSSNSKCNTANTLDTEHDLLHWYSKQHVRHLCNCVSTHTALTLYSNMSQVGMVMLY